MTTPIIQCDALHSACSCKAQLTQIPEPCGVTFPCAGPSSTSGRSNLLCINSTEWGGTFPSVLYWYEGKWRCKACITGSYSDEVDKSLVTLESALNRLDYRFVAVKESK